MTIKDVFSKIKNFFIRTKYFWSKLGFALLTLLLTVVITFLLIKSLPGDVVHNYALSLQGSLKISYDDALILAKRLLNYDPD